MSKSYAIQWKSMLNGRSGRGTNLFELEEAQRLANELNQQYPSILHEPVEASAPVDTTATGAEPEPAVPSEGGSESQHVTHDPDHALSLK